MRVELVDRPNGIKRLEILLGNDIYVKNLDDGRKLADWIYELLGYCAVMSKRESCHG